MKISVPGFLLYKKETSLHNNFNIVLFLKTKGIFNYDLFLHENIFGINSLSKRFGGLDYFKLYMFSVNIDSFDVDGLVKNGYSQKDEFKKNKGISLNKIIFDKVEQLREDYAKPILMFPVVGLCLYKLLMYMNRVITWGLAYSEQIYYGDIFERYYNFLELIKHNFYDSQGLKIKPLQVLQNWLILLLDIYSETGFFDDSLITNTKKIVKLDNISNIIDRLNYFHITLFNKQEKVFNCLKEVWSELS